MQNIQKQVKELFLRAQQNEEKPKAVDLISGKFDDYERERWEKDKIVKELKSEVSDLNTSVKNLENQLDRQEQYSRDDIPLRTINEHLKLKLTEKELDCTHRIANPKSGNKRPRNIIVKFAGYNTRIKVFVN